MFRNHYCNYFLLLYIIKALIFHLAQKVTITKTGDEIIARILDRFLRWGGGGCAKYPGWSLPVWGVGTATSGPGWSGGKPRVHLLARWPDAQGAILSNGQASSGWVCKRGDKGAEWLKGSLAHLEPEHTVVTAAGTRSDSREGQRWLISSLLLSNHPLKAK